MEDQSKTKQALIQELVSSRRRIEELELSESEGKREKEELKQSEASFRSYFDLPLFGIAITSSEKGCILVNDRLCSILGYSRDEILHMTWPGMIHPDDREMVRERYLKRMNDEEVPDVFQLNIIAKDGTVKWIEIRETPASWEGKPATLNFFTDITDRKRTEEALKESEKKYRLLADNVNDVIFVLDMNLNFTYVSPSVKFLRGYEPEEAIKQRPAETLTPSSWDLAMKTLSEVMELEKSGRREAPITRTLKLEMMRKDGTTVWTEVKLSFIRDEDRQPEGILGVTRNIAERERAEKELQQTLKRLRDAVGTTIQVMVTAVESRDPYTAGHQLRSADLARAIATEMGLSQDEIHCIRMAGSIHDIGKLSIPAEILSKPTKLTTSEFSLIQEHSQKGYDMLKDVKSPWPLAQIVYQHHERINGSGYPRNLKGDDILMEARILAVADVVESMASYRPYRPALGIGTALEEIEKNKGLLYDPDVADACIRLFREKGFNLQKI